MRFTSTCDFRPVSSSSSNVTSGFSSSTSDSLSSMSSMSSISPTSPPAGILSSCNSLSLNHYSPSTAVESQLDSATRVHKISTTNLTNPHMQDVFVSIVKGRKAWKKLNGGEAVWPPELEAALLEGLDNYKPVDSRETRLLGRFPMRNIFISDWIFERTGRRRSAKQVGSRLQQLRDTYVGKKLTAMKLLAPVSNFSDTWRHSPSTVEGCAHNSGLQQQSYTSAPAPAHSHARLYDSEGQRDNKANASAVLQSLLFRGVEPFISTTSNPIDDLIVLEGVRTVVFIDLLPRGDESLVEGYASGQKEEIAEEARFREQGYDVTHVSPQARRLGEIDPTVTLISRVHTSPSGCYSDFTVYEDAQPIFTESTPMQSTPHIFGSQNGESESSCVLYQTSLVPGFWDTIVESDDASRYSIVHKVFHYNAYEHSGDGERESKALFLTMYRFVFSDLPSSPASASCLSPSPSPLYFPTQSHAGTSPTPLNLHSSLIGATLNSEAESFDDLSFDKSLPARSSSGQLSWTSDMASTTDYKLLNGVNNNCHAITGLMVDTMSMSSSNTYVPSITTGNDWNYCYYGPMFADQVDNADSRDATSAHLR